MTILKGLASKAIEFLMDEVQCWGALRDVLCMHATPTVSQRPYATAAALTRFKYVNPVAVPYKFAR